MTGEAFKALLESFGDGLSAIQVATMKQILSDAMSGVFTAGGSIGFGIPQLYSVFSTVSVVLLLVYFSMDIFDKVASENFTPDVLILNFAKLIAGIAMVNNGLYIIQGIYGISEMVSSKIVDASVNLVFTVNDPGEVKSFWDFLAMSVEGILFVTNGTISLFNNLLLGTISLICINVVAYQRAVNLAVRTIIAPLMFADVIGHGFTNKSMHYIKVILAICMEGPIICISIAFMSVAMNGTGANLNAIVMVFIIIKAICGASKTAKELIV